MGGQGDRIQSWQQFLEGRPPEQVLRWTVCQFAGRVALASSLGLEDQVLTEMIARASLDIPIFTLDTGRLFPETYELIERTRARYGIPIRIYFPDTEAVEEMVNRYGINLFLDSPELRRRCCQARKVRPLKRALSGLDAWVTGLRREQSTTREQAQIIEWDQLHGLVKLNPLAAWQDDEVRAYVKAHDVPYNRLHDRGFPSIGCASCTRAVASGADPRSGRWWWERSEHRECGLHTHANDSIGAREASR